MIRSKISWCDFSGRDLNFVTGCTPVSPGCANCYARAIYERFGRDFSTVTWSWEKLYHATGREYPQVGNVRGPGSKPICFVCDTGDLFHKEVPYGLSASAIIWMGERDDVDWAVLTKRPENIPSDVTWPDNVWLGVTAENQARADERIPLLMDIPAKVRFVSVEPMLGPVSIEKWLWDGMRPGQEGKYTQHEYRLGLVHWVICGGESGPKRRPFDPTWAFHLWAECREAGVPFFFKQGSGLRPGTDDRLAGHEIKEWPSGS